MRGTLESFLSLDGLVDTSTDDDDNVHPRAVHETKQAKNAPPQNETFPEEVKPLTFAVSGVLNWDLLVNERTRLESDFVHDSIRKNASYLANSGTEEKLRKDGSKVDQFGVSLMNKLREYNDGATCSSSGGYRQMRHTGIPNATKIDPRSEGRSLVAEKASAVCTLYSYCRMILSNNKLVGIHQGSVETLWAIPFHSRSSCRCRCIPPG